MNNCLFHAEANHHRHTEAEQKNKGEQIWFDTQGRMKRGTEIAGMAEIEQTLVQTLQNSTANPKTGKVADIIESLPQNAQK